MDIKWILAGSDVLSGRKSIRQQLVSVAQRKCLSVKALFWKPWGWSNSLADAACNRGERTKLETTNVEEGEVVDDSIDPKRSSKINFASSDVDSITSSQQFLTEKALAELILPCIDRSSTDLRTRLFHEDADLSLSLAHMSPSKRDESFEAELDRMELPSSIRRRLQAAMPILPASISISLTCHPPLLSNLGLASAQQSTTTSGPSHKLISSTRLPIKSKTVSSQDLEGEIDPWTLLEDGTATCAASSSVGSAAAAIGEQTNTKACSWLKGSVRVRRTALNYVGSLDEDS
ncbi:hypothetical protein HPP92_025393 [Vanilla planifolia]|uniref:Uncharacterized protein n=1 Tax=Vanilla planifolia TaxID=51239 RepID=A0A835PJ38_VANPL|nr:hypothetical protein HPP92_025393 [Vanilla planifolia]